MENKVIDFPTAEVQKKAEKSERRERLKRQLSLLPQYRGEVASKNNMRQLPDLKRNEIFWVDMEGCAYVVADVAPDKKGHTRVVIKKLDETATISTGMSVYDLNKSIVAKEKVMDLKDEAAIAELEKQVEAWECGVGNEFYLLYGRDIHYVTLFRRTQEGKTTLLSGLLDALHEVGDVISIDIDTQGDAHCIEVWVRTGLSDAELLYLMPYDKGLINL